jgi:hypothetical protein
MMLRGWVALSYLGVSIAGCADDHPNAPWWCAKLAGLPAGTSADHPFHESTFVQHTTGAVSAPSEHSAYMSFAYTASPSGEATGDIAGGLTATCASGDPCADPVRSFWRATYTSPDDATPLYMSAVTGEPDTYRLKNYWYETQVWPHTQYRSWATVNNANYGKSRCVA